MIIVTQNHVWKLNITFLRIKKNNTLNVVLEKPTNYHVFVLIVSTKSHLKRDERFHPD